MTLHINIGLTWIQHMDFTDTASQFISKNFLTVFNTFLIGITILLSYQSYQFQTRTGIRESLEQLDDVEFNQEKLRPILHDFVFRPLRGHRATVHLKYYRFGTNPASANKSHYNVFERTFFYLNDRDASGIPEIRLRNAITEKLSGMAEIEDVWIEDTGIFLELDTGNAVEVRRRTEAVLQNLTDWHTTDKDTFMDRFDMDSWEPIDQSRQ